MSAKYWWENVCRSKCGWTLTPINAEYLPHKERTPLSVSGPLSPMNTMLLATDGLELGDKLVGGVAGAGFC